MRSELSTGLPTDLSIPYREEECCSSRENMSAAVALRCDRMPSRPLQQLQTDGASVRHERRSVCGTALIR